MRLVSFTLGTARSYGAIKDGGVVDLARNLATRGLNTLKQLLEDNALDEARNIVAVAGIDYRLDELKLLPVIPDPGKIICVGMNYRDHVAEVGRAVTDKPALFARFPESQVGHEQNLIKPRISDQYDYEGELAVVIGKRGRAIAEDSALDHVAGYSCYNEGSVRDWQRHTSQFLAGKTFAGSGAFGPWLVTTDEIPDPSRLTLETRLNGDVVQKAKTDQLITGVPGLIAYCSTITTLEPGDVIVTGTPSGVGLARKPPLFMKPGDVVEVEISGIGTLRNEVRSEV